jgi:hypothetical protein
MDSVSCREWRNLATPQNPEREPAQVLSAVCHDRTPPNAAASLAFRAQVPAGCSPEQRWNTPEDTAAEMPGPDPKLFPKASRNPSTSGGIVPSDKVK